MVINIDPMGLDEIRIADAFKRCVSEHPHLSTKDAWRFARRMLTPEEESIVRFGGRICGQRRWDHDRNLYALCGKSIQVTDPSTAFCSCKDGDVLFKNTIPIEDFDQLNEACMGQWIEKR